MGVGVPKCGFREAWAFACKTARAKTQKRGSVTQSLLSFAAK